MIEVIYLFGQTRCNELRARPNAPANKTAGIIGDDLAVNAEKASGFMSAREIPVLWAITKGSFLNKIIILPIAFLLSAFLPALVTAILILGGLYLAYEGAEKIFEFIFPHAHPEDAPVLEELSKAEVLAREKGKIKSAIITDFILSVEIVIIALSSVTQGPLLTQILVVSLIAIVATVGVYGVVAMIVRMDELGARLRNLNEHENSFSDYIGRYLVWALPKVIKSLSVVGTIALLLVSGGIFTHNIQFSNGIFENIPSIIVEFVFGLGVGFLMVLIVSGSKKIWNLNSS